VGLIVAYTVADIGGNDSHTWLGLVNSLAVAVVAPVAGAVSDLVGRRYVGLTGVLLIIAGMIVVGTAHSMSVAIGGMALAGAGSGLAQTVGVAGACEIAPVKNRGAYLGTIYLFFILMAPASAYGILPLGNS
jgi:MFS family permease